MVLLDDDIVNQLNKKTINKFRSLRKEMDIYNQDQFETDSENS